MANLVKIQNLTVSYNHKIAIEQINLDISEREIIGITGPNGGGKTTLLRSILGLVKPQSGTITFDHPLSIGYLPQVNRLDRQFPICVEDIILGGLQSGKMLSRPTDKERLKAKELIERMGLTSQALTPIGSLSGGQLQRALLSRALIMNPELLILDEPSTYLDEEGKTLLREVIQDVSSHCAVLVVSHNLEAIQNIANRILYINQTLK